MPNTEYKPQEVYDKYVALQKQLATNITNKGVTASENELYDNLINKVAQIEELKGEEKVLENFTNALSEPKIVVQLKYPDNTPKTLNAKLGSKNLFDISSSVGFRSRYQGVTSTISGTTITATSTTNRSCQLLLGEFPAGTYTISFSNTDFGLLMLQYGEALGQLSRLDNVNFASSKSHTFTLTQPRKLWLESTISTNQTRTITDIQVELGSTATTYIPYISDFSTVTVTRCGKNLFDKSTLITGTGVSDLTQTANGFTFKNTLTSSTMSVSTTLYLPAGTYYCSGTVACSDTSYKGGWAVYDNDNRTFIINASSRGTIADVFTITESKRYSLNFYAPYSAPVGVTMTFENVQLEFGSTATEYEPYQGQTYTPTATGEVTGITNLYPTTTLLTDNAGVVFEQVTGGTYKEILPSTDKNGIVKAYQPSVDNTIDSNIKPENIKKDVSILGVTGDYICNYTYDETTKELVLIL